MTLDSFDGSLQLGGEFVTQSGSLPIVVVDGVVQLYFRWDGGRGSSTFLALVDSIEHLVKRGNFDFAGTVGSQAVFNL